MVDLGSAGLLWRHVADSAEHGACNSGGLQDRAALVRHGRQRCDEASHAEIQQLDPTIVRDKDIFRFHVAVDDALFVSRGQAGGDRDAIIGGTAR